MPDLPLPDWIPAPRLRPLVQRRLGRLGDYRVFAVEEHDVFDHAGVERGNVYLLTCPDWCNVVAITPNDELVMIWQHRFGPEALALEIAGGVIEPGESPERAAQRELEEETGYVADTMVSLGSVMPNPALQTNRCHFFLALGARYAKKTHGEPLEECETVLVPASRTIDLIDGGFVEHVMAVAALERYARQRPSR